MIASKTDDTPPPVGIVDFFGTSILAETFTNYFEQIELSLGNIFFFFESSVKIISFLTL